MTIVKILKNGESIKELKVSLCKSHSQYNSVLNKTFNKAIDMAGGLWNGKDKFVVKIL